MIKPAASPPFRIQAGEVHRRFHSAAISLSGLIAGHQQAFTRRCARSVKLGLFLIWLIILQRVLTLAAFPTQPECAVQLR
jgi:hypothetical protein